MLSAVVSNLGLDRIVAIDAPVPHLVYPPTLGLIFIPLALPRPTTRIRRGAAITPEALAALHAARADWIDRMSAALAGFDAVLSPTVPMIPPPLAPLLADDAAFFEVNARLLRNPSVVNLLDGCAISLPCHAPGTAPVGLMAWSLGGRDDRLLSLALQLEAALKPARESAR